MHKICAKTGSRGDHPVVKSDGKEADSRKIPKIGTKKGICSSKQGFAPKKRDPVFFSIPTMPMIELIEKLRLAKDDKVRREIYWKLVALIQKKSGT